MDSQPRDARTALFQAIADEAAASAATKLPPDLHATLVKLTCTCMDFGAQKDVIFKWEIQFQSQDEKAYIASHLCRNVKKQGVPFPKPWRTALHCAVLQGLARDSSMHLRGHGDATCTLLGQARPAPTPSSLSGTACGSIVVLNEQCLRVPYLLCAHVYASHWLCYCCPGDSAYVTSSRMFDDEDLVLRNVEVDIWPSNDILPEDENLASEVQKNPKAWDVLVAIAKARAEEVNAKLWKRTSAPVATGDGFLNDPWDWEGGGRLRLVVRWSLKPLDGSPVRHSFSDVLVKNALQGRLFPLPGRWREALSNGGIIGQFDCQRHMLTQAKKSTAEDFYRYIAAASGVADSIVRKCIGGIRRYAAEELRRNGWCNLPRLAILRFNPIFFRSAKATEISSLAWCHRERVKPSSQKFVARVCRTFHASVKLKICGPASSSRMHSARVRFRGTVAQLSARLMKKNKPKKTLAHKCISVQEGIEQEVVTKLFRAIRDYAAVTLRKDGVFDLPGLATWTCKRIPARPARMYKKRGKDIAGKGRGPSVNIKVKLANRFKDTVAV